MPMSVRTAEPRHHVSAALLWVLVGGCWTVQLFLPWTTRGAFASSSMLDGVRLLRTGVVDAVVPSWGIYLLLALPAIGLSVTGLAGLTGPVADVGRIVLGLAGAVVVAVAWHLLAASQPSRVGPGGWVSAAGALLAGAAVLVAARGRRLLEEPSS